MSEHKDYGLPLPTSNLLGTTNLSLAEIEFSALAKHLCDGKHLDMYDGKQKAKKYSGGSFFKYLFEASWLAPQGSDRKFSFLNVLPQQTVDVTSSDRSHQLVENEVYTVYTRSHVSSMERVSDIQFRLHRTYEKGCKTVHVYLTTPHYAAVYKLKEQRNKYVAHNSSATLCTKDFKALFADVKECYRTLKVSEERLEQIEEGISLSVLFNTTQHTCRAQLRPGIIINLAFLKMLGLVLANFSVLQKFCK